MQNSEARKRKEKKAQTSQTHLDLELRDFIVVVRALAVHANGIERHLAELERSGITESREFWNDALAEVRLVQEKMREARTDRELF